MKKFVILLIAVIILAGAWYFLSPLLIDKVVDEDLDFEVPTTEVQEDLVINFEDTQLTQSEIDRMTPNQQQEMEMKLVEMAETMPPVVVMEESMVELEAMDVIRTGSFVGADNFHQGSGQVFAVVDRDPSIIRFENFDVTNGPDLRVLLSTSEDPEKDLGEYVEIGKLKGNKGNQNYEVPNGVDVSKYASVVIYCKPFHVLFASAALQ